MAEKLDAGRNGLVIEIEMSIVKPWHVGFTFLEQAEKEETGWHPLTVEGKVLAAHDRIGQG